MKLAGARVLVTGGSGGIGESIAREVAGRGARDALVARSEGPLKELAPTEMLDGIEEYACGGRSGRCCSRSRPSSPAASSRSS